MAALRIGGFVVEGYETTILTARRFQASASEASAGLKRNDVNAQSAIE